MRKIVVALAATLVVFFGMGAPAHAQYGADAGVVTVSPPTVVPGGTVTVTVSNCEPGERVDVSAAGVSVQITCDADGTASTTLSMPVTPGTYTGSATGAITGFTTTFVVTVLAVDAAARWSAVDGFRWL